MRKFIELVNDNNESTGILVAIDAIIAFYPKEGTTVIEIESGTKFSLSDKDSKTIHNELRQEARQTSYDTVK